LPEFPARNEALPARLAELAGMPAVPPAPTFSDHPDRSAVFCEFVVGGKQHQRFGHRLGDQQAIKRVFVAV
jgi:hypothetical protein